MPKNFCGVCRNAICVTDGRVEMRYIHHVSAKDRKTLMLKWSPNGRIRFHEGCWLGLLKKNKWRVDNINYKPSIKANARQRQGQKGKGNNRANSISLLDSDDSDSDEDYTDEQSDNDNSDEDDVVPEPVALEIVPVMGRKEKMMVKEARETAEYFDSDASLTRKAERLAKLVLSSNHMCAFTGAGISTAAGIGDYRGPSGKWTMENQVTSKDDAAAAAAADGDGDGDSDGDDADAVEGVQYEDLRPTYTHEALFKLYQLDYLKYIISQNCDGLHTLTGFPSTCISELHGNLYVEYCADCGKEYERNYYTPDDSADTWLDQLEAREKEEKKRQREERRRGKGKGKGKRAGTGKKRKRPPKKWAHVEKCDTCECNHYTGRYCTERVAVKDARDTDDDHSGDNDGVGGRSGNARSRGGDAREEGKSARESECGGRDNSKDRDNEMDTDNDDDNDNDNDNDNANDEKKTETETKKVSGNKGQGDAMIDLTGCDEEGSTRAGTRRRSKRLKTKSKQQQQQQQQHQHQQQQHTQTHTNANTSTNTGKGKGKGKGGGGKRGRACGGKLRDTIINFGDMLRACQMDRATHNAENNDLMLSLGTSMTVTPANALVTMGDPMRLVICNRQTTDLDARATLRVYGDCDALMQRVLALVMHAHAGARGETRGETIVRREAGVGEGEAAWRRTLKKKMKTYNAKRK